MSHLRYIVLATGTHLKTARHELQFSQRELARILDLARSTIVRWEKLGAETIPNPLLKRALGYVWEEFHPWLELMYQEVQIFPLCFDIELPVDHIFQVTKVTNTHVHFSSSLTRQRHIVIPRNCLTPPDSECSDYDPRALIEAGKLALVDEPIGLRWRFRGDAQM